MSENGEIYTAGKNFTLPPALTALTNSTSGMALEIRQVQEARRSTVKVFSRGAFQGDTQNFPPEKVQDVQVFASPEKRNGNIATELWKWVITQPGEIRRLSIAVPDSSGSEDSPTDVDSPNDWDQGDSNSTRNIDSSWGEWFSPCKKNCSTPLKH